MFVRVILTFWCLFVCANASAELWTKRLNVNYGLGDGENMLEGKEKAIEMLKKDALQQAGSYIQSTINLSNDQLVEKVVRISSGIVKVSNINARPNLIKDRFFINLSADVSIDQSVLEDRIRSINQSKTHQKKLDELYEKSLAINEKLESLTTDIAENESIEAQINSLIEQQNDLIKDAGSVQRQSVDVPVGVSSRTEVIFAKGALLEMAKNQQKIADAERIKLFQESKKRRKIIMDVNKVLIKTPINVELIKLVPSGDKYDAHVRVTWKVNHKKIRQILEQHLKLDKIGYRAHETTAFGIDQNKDKDDWLFTAHLNLYSFYANISMGHLNKTLPIVYRSDNKCRSEGSISTQYFCIVSLSESREPVVVNERAKVYAPSYRNGFKYVHQSKTNTVVFSFTKEDLENNPSIAANIYPYLSPNDI